MVKKVITYGTFDMFHIGHLNLLKRAKDLGDYLIVAVSTDKFNRIKGKNVVIPYEQRKRIIESISYVDEVIPEENWEQKTQDIEEKDVDVFTIGDDWEGEFDFLEEYCEVTYLPRTEGISTTKIKNKLSGEDF